MASIAALLLASGGAHAEPTFCPVAGNYRGQYSGNSDFGTLAAIVEPADGTVRGVAVSADGRQFPFGRVIARDTCEGQVNTTIHMCPLSHSAICRWRPATAPDAWAW